MTTHQNRCEELATELERLNARANPGDGTDWLSACEDLGEFYAANTREIIALLRSLASQPAIPADASELAEAARACLALLESIEDKTLIGDEGCLWPVERLRVALSAQPAGGAVGEDAELERIMRMSGSELRADLISQGENPDVVAEQTRSVVNRAMKIADLHRKVAALEEGRAAAANLLKTVFNYAEHPELPDDVFGEIGYFLMQNDPVEPEPHMGLTTEDDITLISELKNEYECGDAPDVDCVTGLLKRAHDRLLAIRTADLRAAAPSPSGGGWMPIETAPKSLAEGSRVRGVYLLGFCPEDGADPTGCIDVIWWEPLTKSENGKMGCWYSGGALGSRPTHWQPLPQPPQVQP